MKTNHLSIPYSLFLSVSLFFISSLGVTAQNQTESFSKSFSIPVNGSSWLEVNEIFRFTKSSIDQVIGAVELEVSNVRHESTFQLYIGEVLLDQAKVKAGTTPRFSLRPPFRVLYQSRLPIKVRVQGLCTVNKISYGFDPRPNRTDVAAGVSNGNGIGIEGGNGNGVVVGSNPQANTSGGTPKPSVNPAAPTISTTVLTPSRWGTRTRITWLQDPLPAGQPGGNVVDGWDFPHRASDDDGQTANFLGTSGQCLSLFFDQALRIPYDQLQQLEVSIRGRGNVEVGFSRYPLQETLVEKVNLNGLHKINFGVLMLPKDQLKQLEIFIRPTSNAEIDSVKASLTLLTNSSQTQANRNAPPTRQGSGKQSVPRRDTNNFNFRLQP